jgi:hypothetical protein
MQQAYNPQTGEVLFLVNNQWVKPQQEALNPKTNERAFLVGNEWQVVPSSAFGATTQPEPKPEDQSIFRSVADPFLKAGSGVVMGVRMIADAFGAGSDTSQALKGAEDWIAALYSAQSQRDSKKVAQIIDAAKDKGVWEQVKAGFSAFLEAPVDIVAQGLGTAAPAIFASLATTVIGAPAAVTTAAGLGIGALMGTGTVKGAIYDAVKEELSKVPNMPKDEIERRAELAQRYNGENLDQILMGGAIGGLSARTGLESSIAKAAAARIAGRTAAAEAAEAATRQQVAKETAEAAARGPLLQGVRTAGIESGTEFLQGGQEQLAQNLALQREGFDVPTFRGVVAQGTLEALAGAPLGGAFGAREAVVARQEQERLDQIRALVNPPPPDPSFDPDEQAQQLATWYEQAVTPELAGVMAREMTALRSTAEQQAVDAGLTLPPLTQAAEGAGQVVNVDPERVKALEDAFLAAGKTPAIARLRAILVATKEAYDDWFAEQEAAQGIENVRGPIRPAGGEGVRVAGEPPAGPPTGRAGVSEATGVVSLATDAGVPAGRKEPAPGTVKTVTPTPDLTGAPSGTQAPQAVEAKEKGPTVPTEGTAEAAAAKTAVPKKPEKPEKPLNAWQLADKLASEVGGDVSAEAKQEELKKTLEARGVKPAGVDAAVNRFSKKIPKTQPKARAVAAPKLSLRNARFAGAPGAERLFRASAAGKKYPGKFWSSIKEYAERYLTKGADKGQRTLDETAELPKRTLNVTTLSQAPQAERDAFLGDFTAWMQKNAPDVPIEDTQLYDVLTGQATDFAYPQKEDVKYLKYMGYDSVFFAEEGGEKVDTWFVFDKRERAEAVEPKPKRERGRPALPKEEREARAEARTGVRAQANRDARRLQKAASDLTTKNKERRTDALYNLYDIYKTSQSTPRRSQAKGMLDANTTEAERRTIEDGYKDWQAKQAEIAAFEATEREQKKTARLTPEEKQQKQEATKKAKEEAAKKRAEEKEAKQKAKAARKAEREATAAERRAKQTERIRIQREDKINAQKDKIAKLGKKLAEFRQNKPVNETELLIKEKQYKLEQLRLKVFEDKPIDWSADWEQGTKVRSLEAAAQEIRALQPKEKTKTGKSAAQLLAEARAYGETVDTVEETETDDNALANLFDKQVEEEEEVEEVKKPAGEKKVEAKGKKPAGEKLNPITVEMYHGSPNEKIQEFSGLTFFTSDQSVATQYAKKQVAFAGATATGSGRIYQVSITTKNTLDLRKNAHRAAYDKARSTWNKAHDSDEQLPPLTSEGFLISKTGLPSYGRIASVLQALPQFDSAFVDEGTQGTSLAVVNGSTAQIKTPTEPKQLTPQEQYASLVENVPGAPAFDALSKEAQEQITDLAKRNQLNLAAISRITTAQAPKFSQTPNVDRADARFSKFTTAGQAAAHVARTGNSFQRALARRLSSLKLLQDTKFVVLEPGAPTPKQLEGDARWLTARGVFIPEANTVYVKSAADPRQGVNNITVLHEALHVALQAKIDAGRQRLKAYRDALLRNQPVSGFATEVEGLFIDLSRISRRAEAHFRSLPDMPEELLLTVAGTENKRTGKYDIFSNLDEFLSYGMSDPVFQNFLKTVPMEGATGFSRFVQAILRFLGMAANDQSALVRLVDVTDRLLDVPSEFEQAQQAVFAQAAAALTPTTPPATKVATKAKAKKQKVDATLQKVLRSHSSSPTFMDGIRQLVNERNSDLLLDVLTSKFTAFKGSALRQLLPTLQTETLVDWASRLGLKNPEVAWDAVKGMQAMQTRMQTEAAELSERQVKLQLKDPEMYKLLGVVQDYSTLRRIDPTKVDLNELDAKGKPKYATLRAYWNRLSPEAKKLYEETRDYYVKNYDLHYDLLNNWITAFDLPGDVSDASTPRGNLIASIRKMQETGRKIDPYFPLMRYGDFWVRIGKGKSGKIYMFESQADKELFIKTWFREYQKDNPSADLTQLREDGVLSDGNDIQSARKDMTKYYDVLKNMFDTIDGMKPAGTTDDFGNKRPELDRVNKERLKDHIYQMILHTLPDASFRKQFIHRQGKEGFSGDLARNFATLSAAMANQLPRLKYGPMITNVMRAAEEELKGNPEAARLREFVTEMKIRAGREMAPSPENSLGHRAANFANQTAFLYMMTNVKTAVAQMFAVPTFTAPVLASRHGIKRTAKVLGSFAAIWNSVGVRRENTDGSTSWVAPTIAQSKRVKLNPEERRAAQYMIDRGLTETTLAYDLGNRKKIPTEVQNSTFRRGARAAINAMTALFHHSERLIREVTFMASFRLNRQKFPNKSFEEIARLAEKETYDALNNFSSTNRPRGIGATAEREVLLDAHKPLGRAILQFKMFPAFVTTYFVRNLYRMLGKGYTKAERKEAMTQFFGTILMSFTLAGVMGIPGFSFALGVLSGLRKVMMDDDDDDPLEKRDLMLWFRNVWLPQTFGNITIASKPISDLMDRGVVAALTGFDFTGSMSLNNMWFPELKETATAQAAMQDYMLSLMGPFASLISKQIPKAIDNFNQGKILEGMEQLLPAIARSPVTAYRYATEGASTTWGAEIKPANEFTVGQIIGQSLGFSTEGLVARREDLFKANALRIQIQNQKRSLMDRLDLELREDGNVEKVLEDIFKYNAKNWFDPIRPSEITKSLRSRLERRASADRGLAVEKKYYPQLIELFAVSERKLATEAAR